MIHAVKRILPRELHAAVRPTYQRLRRWLATLDHACDKRTMSLAQFLQLLEQLGITSGATVMIHSSMDHIVRRVPELNSMRLIRLLQDLVGRAGTLLMPTFPFLGLQLHYVEKQDTFDPVKTPSQVGLVTEIFRRMPGVSRSLHPTHPVAGWGKHARDLLATHHLGATFGPDSPMYKLQEYGGLVVGVGVGLGSFTILHVAEELHPEVHESRFEVEPRTMTIIDGPKRIPYTFKVLKAGVEYDLDRITAFLSKGGTLKCVNRRGLQCASAPADQLIKQSLELIEQHLFFASRWSITGWP